MSKKFVFASIRG